MSLIREVLEKAAQNGKYRGWRGGIGDICR